MTTQTDTKTITLAAAKKYIKSNILKQIHCLENDVPCSPIIIQGPPGIGKSDIVKEICVDEGFGLNTQYLGTMLLEAFGMPLPTLNEDAIFQRWSAPEFYKTDHLEVQPTKKGGYVVLFLDDIHLATKTISNYLFQLLLGRSIHNKKMPDNFILILAGNRVQDRANAQTLVSPVVNRLCTLDVSSNADEWIENFAVKFGVRDDITSFIGWYPQLLNGEPLENSAWSSARSWTYLSMEIDQLEKVFGTPSIDDIITTAQGHVGTSAALTFAEYVKSFRACNAREYFDKNKIPELGDKNDGSKKMLSYIYATAMTSELLKDLRLAEWDFKNTKIMKEVELIKKLFNEMIDNCPEIIPMTLKNLVLSENITVGTAQLYAAITAKNTKLVKITKKLLT